MVAAQSPEAKIMALGDSITRGTNDINYPNGSIPGGYRKELGIRLGNGGFAYDFVGSSIQNAAAGMDPDHEGHDGYRTDTLLANLPTWLAVNPDVVLLHAGTNDILENISVSTAAGNLGLIIDAVTANAPNRRLYVATIVPITQAWPPQTQTYSAAYLNGNVNAYNVQVRNLVTQYANQGRKVFLVEMNGSLVYTDPVPANNFYQTGDGIHPGQAGYNQMATVWFNSITATGSLFLPPPTGVPAAPSSLTATVISGTQINLSWLDNSGDETGFSVYRKTGSGGTWQQIATVGANATISGISGLLTGANSYFFAVRAINASGDSAWSNVSSSVPINVALNKPASASSIYSGATVASNANNGNLTTFWSATLTDPAASWAVDLTNVFRISRLEVTTRQDADQPVTRKNFEVRASNDSAFATYTVLATQGEPPLSHASTLAADINPITPFRYVKVAKTDGGYFSFTEIRIFGSVPPAVPTAPSNLVVTQTTGHDITLGWADNSTGETAFKLERKAGAGGTFAEIAIAPANTTSFIDAGLAPATGYIYRLRATNGVDNSGYAEEVGAATNPLTGYEAWAVNYPQFVSLPAGDQLPTADPNGDGINNLLAYAFALDPLSPLASGSLPVVTTNPAPSFRFRRSTTSGLTYELLVSTNLSGENWQVASQEGATVEAIPGDPSAELVTIPLEAGAERKFARLRVIQN
ncbi:SGNH/GDSL hydrolase family protein [Luteolibacter sp.]|uniref:SGNH/GDSL hydrolase family protein n=1 Tax=Luteolibacter sp. TaxID=1962973 RepID=UPI003267B5E2